MVQTNTRHVTMYVKYNCTIMSAVWCYTVDVCQQCIHVKDLRIKLPLISFERTGAGKPRPTTFQTRRKKKEKNRNPAAESECPDFSHICRLAF